MDLTQTQREDMVSIALNSVPALLMLFVMTSQANVLAGYVATQAKRLHVTKVSY